MNGGPTTAESERTRRQRRAERDVAGPDLTAARGAHREVADQADVDGGETPAGETPGAEVLRGETPGGEVAAARSRDLELEFGDCALAATLYLPERAAPRPAIVLVEGSGPGTRAEWGEWLSASVGAEFAVLAYDKPGCGESAGDWRTQTLEDRSAETVAAVELVSRQPEVDPHQVTLLGVGHGAWVAILAAARSSAVAAVAAVSGPGVGAADQERHRIATQLKADGYGPIEIQQAMAVFQRRLTLLTSGQRPASVFAEEQAYSRERWYPILGTPTAADLAFMAAIYGFDPGPALQAVSCPVLALLGGEDTLLPVEDSVRHYVTNLGIRQPGSVVVVFPGADHDLRVDHGGRRVRPLVVMATITRWLNSVLRGGV